MSSNWIMKYCDECSKQLYNVAKTKVKKICSEIINHKKRYLKVNFFLWIILVSIGILEDFGARFFGKDLFVSDSCKLCKRCIDNCPTEAILTDRTIDSNRCISYLTIENRGGIPSELRSSIGDWVFGCDVCQDVCPWNMRFAHPSEIQEFQPREFLKHTSSPDFLSLTEDAYRIELQNSPLKRAKLNGLLRNAAITAGNATDPAALPHLASLLTKYHDATVRSICAWAIARINESGNEKIIRDALESEDDPTTKDEITAALNSVLNNPPRS